MNTCAVSAGSPSRPVTTGAASGDDARQHAGPVEDKEQRGADQEQRHRLPRYQRMRSSVF